ncbi:MAG: hypothetical protein AB7I41_03200 [Candidatus Sericytochromatia bacterium]
MALEVHTINYPQEYRSAEPEVWHIGAEQHSVFLLVTGLLLVAFGGNVWSLIDNQSQISGLQLLWQGLFCLFYLGLAFSLWYLQKPLFFLLLTGLLCLSFLAAGFPLLQPALFEVTPLRALSGVLPVLGEQALLPWQMALHYGVLPLAGLWLFFHRSLEALFKPESDALD